MGYAELGYEGQTSFMLVQSQLTQPLKTYYEEMNIRWHKIVQTAIRQINF